MKQTYTPTPEQVARLERVAALVSRIASGDQPAEAEFVREMERPLRAILRTRARLENSEMDDLYQDTVLMALRYMREGKVRDPMAIIAIVRLMALRRVSQWERENRPQERNDVADVSDSYLEDQRDSMQAEHSVEVTEKARLIRESLARMEPLDREILHRFYVLEQNEKTICAALEISAKTFQLRKTRAREIFGLQARAWMKGVKRTSNINWLRKRLDQL